MKWSMGGPSRRITAVVAVLALVVAGIGVAAVFRPTVPEDQPSAGRQFATPAASTGTPTTGRPDGTADPQPEDAPRPEQRLGLHVTHSELSLWRVRADRGPFLRAGDAWDNSPADWERITANSRAFLEAPAAGRWSGPAENNPDGCVRRDGGNHAGDLGWQPPVEPADHLRDAAFRGMVTSNPRAASAVARELVAQARDPGVRFSDRQRWCLGQILDGSPGFMIASWLTKLLFAMDYVLVTNSDALTQEEVAELDSWFASAAEWMRYDTDLKLDELFEDRPAGDYDLSTVALETSSADRVLYAGGPQARVLHRRFNNRNAREARFVTLVGLRTGEEALIDHGRRYVKDALRYAYFPEGAVADFERWSSENPIGGWRYGTQFVGALITIADHLERAGDAGLYLFETTEGALGTEGSHHSGQPKSLHTLVADMLRYVDGTFARYASTNIEAVGNERRRINSVNVKSDDERITEAALVMANRYFRDPYITEVYTRSAPGAPTYPPDPGTGVGDPNSGEHGIYPAALFMFGLTEGAATTTS